jgi:WD40 repeat protein
LLPLFVQFCEKERRQPNEACALFKLGIRPAIVAESFTLWVGQAMARELAAESAAPMARCVGLVHIGGPPKKKIVFMSGLLVHKVYDFKGHRDCVYALEPGQTADQFFSAGGDGLVARWNLNHPDQGELIAKVPNSVYALHYLPAKNWLVVGHNQDGVHFIDVAEKKEVASLQLTTNSIFDIKSAGQVLLVATGDGSVYVIDLNTHKPIKRITASNASARCLAVLPQADEFAVGYSDYHIRVFSLTDFSMRYEWVAHNNSVFALLYAPDGRWLTSGSRDAKLKRWDVAHQYRPVQEVAAHLYAINHLWQSPDNEHFVTCSMDKSLKVWRQEDMTLLKVIDRARHAGHGTSVNKVLWLSEHRIASGSDDRNIAIWNIRFEKGATLMGESRGSQ